METYQYIAFEVYHHFSGLSFIAEVDFWRPLKTVVSCDLFIMIREGSSTLYVGLAHTVPPTNTNFRLTFLITRLQRALLKTYLYRASNLKSNITFLASVS